MFFFDSAPVFWKRDSDLISCFEALAFTGFSILILKWYHYCIGSLLIISCVCWKTDVSKEHTTLKHCFPYCFFWKAQDITAKGVSAIFTSIILCARMYEVLFTWWVIAGHLSVPYEVILLAYCLSPTLLLVDCLAFHPSVPDGDSGIVQWSGAELATVRTRVQTET